MAFFGIDLGTTFCSVATIDETGRPVSISNEAGSNSTPSCILFDGSETPVGEVARKQLFVPGANAIGRFKRDMGTSKTYELDGNTLTPTELSCLLLRKLKEDAENVVGPCGEAVVTIPANFANEAREATLAAAESAGLNVKYIINEPTAAALYYAFNGDAKVSGNYAIYDLGGGTFDVSIVKINGQDVEVLATEGVAKLGGDDFDRALQLVVQKKVLALHGETLDDADFDRNEAEEQKKSLSKRDSVRARVNRKNIELTRSEFEEALSSFIAQTEMLCESALEQAGLGPSDIEAVFLAGGSTRIPLVKESVKRTFNKEPIAGANVDFVVSLGAALYAAHKGDPSKLSSVQRNSIEKMSVEERTSKYFGTLSMDSGNARGESRLSVSIIIPKGEVIPCEITKSFSTIQDGQTAVNCKVTESGTPETDPRFVKIIWEGELELPPGRNAGQEVTVTFGYDENQTMNCRFLDVGSKKETVVDLSPGSAKMDSSNIDKFTVE